MFNIFSNYLAIIIIGYSGFILIFSHQIYNKAHPFEPKKLGYLLLSTAIIWAINKYYYHQSRAQSLYELDKQGIESIKVLSHVNISDFVLSTDASRLCIQINYHQINRNLWHVILALESCQKEIMVLITNCGSSEGRSRTFEQKRLFDLLFDLYGSSFSVRVTSTNAFLSIVFVDNSLLLLIPFKGGEFLGVQSNLAFYRQQFDQIWENSKDLSYL